MSGSRSGSQQQSLGSPPHAGSRPVRAKLALADQATPRQPSPIVEAPPTEVNPDVARFIHVLLSHDEQAAQAFATELIERGFTADELYEGLFADAARTLGEMWAADDCSFYDVTLGAGRIQRLIREFSHQFLASHEYPGATGRVLLSCAVDEQHSLGIAMLAEFFVRDGWDVEIGPGLGSEGLLDKVRGSEYHLLGFSVSVSARISKLQQDIRRARQVSRRRDIRVIVGGQLITADPSLAQRIGADGFAVDARSAVSEARRLISA